MMENFSIVIDSDQETQTFEVRDYLHHEGDKCKFEVFIGEKMVVSLNPDEHTLSVCKNPGKLDDMTIHRIIDRIEAYHL
jgi:hypothetical protein